MVKDGGNGRHTVVYKSHGEKVRRRKSNKQPMLKEVRKWFRHCLQMRLASQASSQFNKLSCVDSWRISAQRWKSFHVEVDDRQIWQIYQGSLDNSCDILWS